MNKRKIQIILLGIMFILLILGVSLSSQDASLSLRVTDKILVLLGLITNSELASKSGRYSTYSRVFREVLHFVMFSAATVPIYLFVYTIVKKIFFTGAITMVIVVAYSLLDEFRQTFSDGRGYERFDLVMDNGGALFSGVLVSVVVLVLRNLGDE